MTLPPSLSDALARVQAVAEMIQGEAFQIRDACIVLALAEWPLGELSREAAVEQNAEGIFGVPHPVDSVVLLTQTCDLIRTSADTPYCQVAPIVDASAAFAYEALRGLRPGWAGLPWVSSTAIADLARITTLERSLLVGMESLGRPWNQQERFHFADTVARHLTRPALPDAVSETLRPFLKRMKEKHDRQSQEGRCIEQIRTIRIEASPDFDTPAPDLNLLLILDEIDLPGLPEHSQLDQGAIDGHRARGVPAAAEAALASEDPVMKREAWMALGELWAQPSATFAEARDDVGDLSVEVLNGEEFSFARSLDAPELDLAFLTTRAA